MEKNKKNLKDLDSPLISKVKVDDHVKWVSQNFDYDFDGESVFHTWKTPELDKNFSIGLIVGGSGTGKTTLLNKFGKPINITWKDNEAIISHFETPQKGAELLSACGLNSLPSWVKPFHSLSNGEQFRANMARQIKDGSVIDEFTSVVDRDVAKSASVGISRYITKNNIKGVIFSSCHMDIIEWLNPDWVFNTNTGELILRRNLRRPEIRIEVYRTDQQSWELFKHHHYLSANIIPVAKCYVAMWGDRPVGFYAAIPFPNGKVKNAWRGHRMVILPEFQGLGIGPRLSEAVGQIYLNEGKRFYTKTCHVRIGEYRNHSPLWRGTKENGKVNSYARKIGKENIVSDKTLSKHIGRVCYSHEYIGNRG